MWWWTIEGRGSGCSAASAAWLGHTVADSDVTTGEGRGGAADNKAAPNKKAGTDARALTSTPLLVRDITDEEGADPKDNPLMAVVAPEEVISAGDVAAEAPKEKSSASADKAS